MVDDIDPTTMELLAWVGPDEFDGSRGIKQGIKMGPAGTRSLVPLAFKGEHLDRATGMREQLQKQASDYGTTIRLVRFTYAEVVETLEPTDELAP